MQMYVKYLSCTVLHVLSISRHRLLHALLTVCYCYFIAALGVSGASCGTPSGVSRSRAYVCDGIPVLLRLWGDGMASRSSGALKAANTSIHLSSRGVFQRPLASSVLRAVPSADTQLTTSVSHLLCGRPSRDSQ